MKEISEEQLNAIDTICYTPTQGDNSVIAIEAVAGS